MFETKQWHLRASYERNGAWTGDQNHFLISFWFGSSQDKIQIIVLMSFPFFFSRFHINNLFFFLILFPSVSFFLLFFFFLMLLFSSSHFSFSAFPFLPPLFFFAHISPLSDIPSFICSLLLTAKIPNSISAAATWVLFLAATGGSSAFFAALDSSQGKQKIRLWKQ